MPAPKVVVVQTGVANLASVIQALRRAGAEPTVTTRTGEVGLADRVVLPGVGAFVAAMESLRESGLFEALRERVRADRPLLAICLGLQVLFEQGEEGGETDGLGIISGTVARFPEVPGVLVPQLGWNRVVPDAGCRLVREGHGYFANSYRATVADEGWSVAWSEHGGPFVAAVERGDIVGCQFHPELSGRWGHELLVRWLTAKGETGGESC